MSMTLFILLALYKWMAKICTLVINLTVKNHTKTFWSLHLQLNHYLFNLIQIASRPFHIFFFHLSRNILGLGLLGLLALLEDLYEPAGNWTMGLNLD